jgi:hypothetical protein
MTSDFAQRRIAQLHDRLRTLAPNVERARQAVLRLEAEPVPAGATAQARAARLSAVRDMSATLAERERHVRIAITALQAELAS